MKKQFLISVSVGLLITLFLIVLISFKQLMDRSSTQDLNTKALISNQEWYLNNVSSDKFGTYIRFEENNKFSGFAICNSFEGKYSINNWALQISEIALTDKDCSENSLAEKELVDRLSSVDDFNLSNDDLLLHSDTETLTFTNNNLSSSGVLNDWVYVKNFVDGKANAIDENYNIRLQFDENENISGRACNSFQGQFTLNLVNNSINISDLASTKIYCEEPTGIMSIEEELLRYLPSAERYFLEGNNLKIYFGTADYIEFQKSVDISRTFSSELATLESVTITESDKDSIEFGEEVTLNVEVRSLEENPELVTGSVVFYNGDSELGEPIALINHKDIDGIATGTLNLQNLEPGAYIITAKYSGNENYLESESDPINLTVNDPVLKDTSINLTANTSSTEQGKPITLSSTVTNDGATEVTGKVEFRNGNNILGTGDVNSSGTATFTTNSLVVGTHAIIAKYLGDELNGASTSNPIAIVVSSPPKAPTLKLSGDKNVTADKTAIVLLEVMGDGFIPTGKAEFFNGSKSLGTASLEDARVQFALKNLPIGENNIKAVYLGDKNYVKTSSAVFKVTNKVPLIKTKLEISSKSQNYREGDDISISLAVTNSGKTKAVGSIKLYNNEEQISSVKLDKDGLAEFTVNLIKGVHSITATYLGNNVYAESQSNTLIIQVDQKLIIPVVKLNSPVTAKNGERLVVTVAVSADETVVPTGTVILENAGSQIAIGVIDEKGEILFTLEDLTVGNYSLSAIYKGDSTFSPSSSNQVSLTVLQNSNKLNLQILLAIILALLAGVVGAVLTIVVKGKSDKNL